MGKQDKSLEKKTSWKPIDFILPIVGDIEHHVRNDEDYSLKSEKDKNISLKNMLTETAFTLYHLTYAAGLPLSLSAFVDKNVGIGVALAELLVIALYPYRKQNRKSSNF